MIDNDHMRSMVKERLEAWKVKGCNKGQLPTNILFYRDGLSESQFASCERSEIKEIKEAYRELGGNVDNLKVTFIVVGKRHNTRFYPTAVKDTYKSTEIRENSTVRITNGNLKPGLLVDNVITNLSPNNFFLQSHCAIKGTARSAHYHVLLDEMALYPGVLPELTLILCYAFPRATKGVSYVAPAYIADRLCERGRAYLRSWHNTGEPFEKPVDDNGKTLNEQEMLHWKKQKAKYLARSPEVWGPQYNDGHDKNNNPRPGDQRLNPWHPSFDNGMFWM
jgi:eukaryotic translation initiation factor 2C